MLGFLVFKKPQAVPAESKGPVVKEIPENPHLTHFLDSLDVHIEDYMERTSVPGAAVVIVHQGKTVYRKGFGVKESNSTHPIDTNTVFRLASVSKGFASVLTGILANDDVLEWEDRVIDHLPWFSLRLKEHTDSLRIEHVLSHTSGLQYQAYTTLVEDGWERDEIIKRLKDVSLISKTGQLYSYQNVAYSIIEPIIESVERKSFQEVMTERIFGPLQMNDASITYDDFIDNDNIASPHLYRGRGRFRKIKISPTYYNVASAGGVNASISDMAKWLKALTGHSPEVVPHDVLARIYSPFVRTSLKERAFRRIDRPVNAYYGLGWRVVHMPMDTIIYHGGYANGYRSGIAISLKEDIGICILTNSSLDLPGETMADFFDIFYQQADSIKSWRYKHIF